MISPYRIVWLGLDNLEFDCWVGLSFNGDNGEASSYLTKEALSSESYNGIMRPTTQYKYSEVFTPSFTLVKQNYEDFTMEENRRILSWLTRSNHPSFLSVYHDDSNAVSYEVLGNFSNVQLYKSGNGKVIGYVCEFSSVSPFAFSALKTVTKTITAPTTFTIESLSDDYNNFVYPKITIEEDSVSVVVNITSEMAADIFDNDNYLEGTVYYNSPNYYYKDDTTNITTTTRPAQIDYTSVRIINETTEQECWVTKNSTSEVIVIDGANKVISNGNSRIFGNDFNWHWLELTHGNNTITVIGNCEITFQWRDYIKAGDL